jgi:zinc and cadmium transporter
VRRLQAAALTAGVDSTLLWIVGGSLAGGAVSVLLAATVAYALLAGWVPRMVSYSVGVLLGVTFLDLLPEAFERADEAHTLFAVVLGGILGFFLLEKAALWRHSHEDEGHGGRSSSGLLILAGDAFHNFVDGVLIAAAFLADFRLGLTTTLAVMVHEIPQEIGDFVVLLHAGYTRARALLLNVAVSLASLAGALVAYAVLEYAESLVQYALALTAACFIYIAVADLIPHLHRHEHRRDLGWQVALIALGVATVAMAGTWLHAH